jgi:hypothetical protein
MRVRVLVVAVAAAAAFTALGLASPGSEPRATTLTLAAPHAYLPHASGGARDDYRCFLLNPKLDRDVFVTNAQFKPDAPGLVHHIILFRALPNQVAAAQALDKAAKGEGWTCFGGTGVDNLSNARQALEDAGWVAAWAPSRSRERLPAGLGVPLTKGSRLIMQVHYSLYDKPQPDRTRAVLTLVPQAGSAIQPLHTMLLPAPVELACPPEEASAPLCDRKAAIADLVKRHGLQAGFVPGALLGFCGKDPAVPQATTVTSCQLRFDEPLTIQLAAGHMHLLGKSITLELNPGTPRARTIVSIPKWDFHNQQFYVVSPPAHVDAGDVMRVTCVHDQRLRHEQHMAPAFHIPRYVLWGEGTGDEMCLGIVQVTRG